MILRYSLYLIKDHLPSEKDEFLTTLKVNIVESYIMSLLHNNLQKSTLSKNECLFIIHTLEVDSLQECVNIINRFSSYIKLQCIDGCSVDRLLEVVVDKDYHGAKLSLAILNGIDSKISSNINNNILTVCGTRVKEYHVHCKQPSPGQGWSKKRVGMKCDHFNTMCWSKPVKEKNMYYVVIVNT